MVITVIEFISIFNLKVTPMGSLKDWTLLSRVRRNVDTARRCEKTCRRCSLRTSSKRTRIRRIPIRDLVRQCALRRESDAKPASMPQYGPEESRLGVTLNKKSETCSVVLQGELIRRRVSRILF